MRAGVRILFFGDVVGSPGRDALGASLPGLRARTSADFVIANGENLAGGLGITEKTASRLLGMGVDVITTGNHVFRHRSVYAYLDAETRVVRPANYRSGNPGRGATIVERGGIRLGVLNLSGTFMLQAERSPFHTVDENVADLRRQCDLIVVDFHAETTSEKVAMGWHLDGRVCAVIGTHTHIPTADGRVLPSGTAYITDVGMTGARDSVIGVRKEQAIERFMTMMPVRFETAKRDLWINALLVEARENGLASSLDQIIEPAGPQGE